MDCVGDSSFGLPWRGGAELLYALAEFTCEDSCYRSYASSHIFRINRLTDWSRNYIDRKYALIQSATFLLHVASLLSVPAFKNGYVLLTTQRVMSWLSYQQSIQSSPNCLQKTCVQHPHIAIGCRAQVLINFRTRRSYKRANNRV